MIFGFIVLLLFVSPPCFAADTTPYPTPSRSQIEKWWKPENREKPDEWLGITDVYPVRLKSGEQAFLASAEFPEQGHCFAGGTVLVRPALQEARQIRSLAGVSEVLDLDHDGITEVIVTGSYMGQGVLSGNKTILYFDDWQPVELYRRKYGDNLGACGRKDYDRSCYSKELIWTFMDLDGDGTEDLVELIVYKKGQESDELTWTTKVNTYLFKEKKFAPAAPGLIEADRMQSDPLARIGGSDPTDSHR